MTNRTSGLWRIALCILPAMAGTWGLPHAPASHAVIASHAPRRADTVRQVNTDSVTAAAILAISEFFIEWQRLWRTSATLRAATQRGQQARDVRLPYLHCHPDANPAARVSVPSGTPEPSAAFLRKYAQYALVKSDHSMFAVCPSWILGESVDDALDEQSTRDGPLALALRPAASAARERLLLALDTAASALPHSAFITGQRLRFTLENGDAEGAVHIVRTCQAGRWWCNALAGYLLDRRGDALAAEQAYRHMERAMQTALPADSLCAWQDIQPLLPAGEAAAFAKLPCSGRAATLATFWLLSDPLFSESGNERWTAHQTRRVDIALRRALDGDERFVWDEERGGDAMERLILRYDWPSYTWWDGRVTDVGHSQYLMVRRTRPVPPYSTFEYSLDRVHLAPTWRATTAPFTARETDWDLAQLAADGLVDAAWWATEHFRPARPLVQLPEGQTALFRRDGHILVAAAHNLTSTRLRENARAMDVLLLSARADNDIDTVAQAVSRTGARVAVRGVLRRQPVALSLEAVVRDTQRVTARARFGVVMPPTLRAMQSGDVGISDLAILDGSSDAGDLRETQEGLLNHMLGSLTLGASSRRVGLYWETYGIAPSDTVTVAVTVQPDVAPGAVRRLGMALRLVSDPTRSLSIRWTEPHPQHHTFTINGAVPAILRSVMLNLDKLTPGQYIVRVSIERLGKPGTSSERRLVLAP